MARPSIVVGDSRTGWTPTFNVVYWPLRAFERGLVGTLPGEPDGILDIVPCDYVAEAIMALHAGAVDRATVHLVAGQAATTNGELAALAARHMNRQLPEFTGDAGELAKLDGALLYLPYLDVRSSFANPRAQELLADEVDPPPPLEEYLGTLLGYARATRWGKRPISRARALAASNAQARTLGRRPGLRRSRSQAARNRRHRSMRRPLETVVGGVVAAVVLRFPCGRVLVVAVVADISVCVGAVCVTRAGGASPGLVRPAAGLPAIGAFVLAPAWGFADAGTT